MQGRAQEGLPNAAGVVWMGLGVPGQPGPTRHHSMSAALNLGPSPQILLLAFLKLIDEGSHMVMLECPETVNTLLHEFLLWEPEPSPKALPEPLPAPPEEKK